MWKQVRETGREGLQEGDGGLLGAEGYGRVNRLGGENWREREGEGRETHGRNRGACERDKERRRKTDTRERQRWEEMEGHLRYRELGPPNSSGFQGNGNGGAPGMIPTPLNG